jgi:hypothetical protein
MAVGRGPGVVADHLVAVLADRYTIHDPSARMSDAKASPDVLGV